MTAPSTRRFVWQPGDFEIEDGQSTVLAEFNPYHDRGGRFAAKTTPASALSPASGPGLAAELLAKGESPTVLPEDVGATMDALANRTDHPDLTELKVEGTLKFGGDGLGIARKDMPQEPEAGREAYMSDLGRRGIRIDRIDVNPQDLHPMQKEIDAVKAAHIYQAIRDGGYRRSNRLTVSSDNYVLDGHHRWAAATAYSFGDKHFTIPIERVGLDHSALLSDAHRYNADHGVANKSFGEARIEEFNANHDNHGRFAAGHGASSGLSAALASTEDDIRHIHGGETAVIFGPDGHEVLRKTQMGDPDGDGPLVAGVDFTEAEKNRLPGTVMTHNHPDAGSGSLSPNDLQFAAKNRLAEMRCVMPDGSTYSIKPGPKGWGAPKDTVVVINRRTNEVIHEYQNKVYDGAPGWPSTMEARAAYGTLHTPDEITKRVAADLGWTYEVHP